MKRLLFVFDMGIQTDTIFTSSDAETQTMISISPNCFQRDVTVQCYMDDVVNEEKGSQTEVSISPSTFPVHISTQCNLFDEKEGPNKENLLGNMCIGNTNDKFYPLVHKHGGTFKDISGRYQLIFK